MLGLIPQKGANYLEGMVKNHTKDPWEKPWDMGFSATWGGRNMSNKIQVDTVDGKNPNTHLGCPKCWFDPSIKTFSGILSGAGFFPSTVSYPVSAITPPPPG